KKITRIMRLTAAILLIASLHVAAAGYSQDRITLNLKSVELRKVLLVIEKKTDYRFLFNESLLDHKPRIDVEAVDKPVTDVLTQVLQNTGINYKLLDDKLVVLKEAGEPGLENLQDVRVSGKVTSSTGDALAGVSITVKGTRAGTTTDVSGNF